jgi:hypothetical protein
MVMKVYTTNTPIGEISCFENDSFAKQVMSLGYYAEQSILDNELKITEAVMNGHQASNGDEFQDTRVKIRQYRIELGLIKK